MRRTCCSRTPPSHPAHAARYIVRTGGPRTAAATNEAEAGAEAAPPALKPEADDDAAESGTAHLSAPTSTSIPADAHVDADAPAAAPAPAQDDAQQEQGQGQQEPEAKRPKLKGAARRKFKKEEAAALAAQAAAAKAKESAAAPKEAAAAGGRDAPSSSASGGMKSGGRGQNRARKFGVMRDDHSPLYISQLALDEETDPLLVHGLCDAVARHPALPLAVGCKFGAGEKGRCKYEHDVGKYLRVKKRDVRFPAPPMIPGAEVGPGEEGVVPKNKVGKQGEDAEEHVSKTYRAVPSAELGLLRPPATSGQAAAAGGQGAEAEAEAEAEAQAQAYLDRLYSTEEPFVKWVAEDAEEEPEAEASADTEEKGATKVAEVGKAGKGEISVTRSLLLGDSATYCPNYHQLDGQCVAGWRCRFLGAHVALLPQDEAEREKAVAGVPSGLVAEDTVMLLGAKSGRVEEPEQGQGGEREKKAEEEDEQTDNNGTNSNNNNEGRAVYRKGEYNWLPPSSVRALRKKEVSSELHEPDGRLRANVPRTLTPLSPPLRNTPSTRSPTRAR